MRIPIGFICSVLGAAVLSYLAIVTLIALPSEGPPRWFAVGGIVGLSLIVGVLVNGISMENFRKVSRDHREASNRSAMLSNVQGADPQQAMDALFADPINTIK